MHAQETRQRTLKQARRTFRDLVRVAYPYNPPANAAYERGDYVELAALAADYQSMKERVDAVEQKGSLARVSGIPQVMDDISSSIGLKGKIKAVKAIGNREVAGGSEESGEVQIEKVTMNELVNLLFRIEEAPMMLSIKRVAFKKSFENPELFNVTLTLSLFLKK